MLREHPNRRHIGLPSSKISSLGRDVRDTTVFGRGQSASRSVNGPSANFNVELCGVFHNRRDLPPPREVVTAALMGDPKPDRVMPDIEDTPGWGEQRQAPIYLTFKDLRRGMEEA